MNTTTTISAHSLAQAAGLDSNLVEAVHLDLLDQLSSEFALNGFTVEVQRDDDDISVTVRGSSKFGGGLWSDQSEYCSDLACAASDDLPLLLIESLRGLLGYIYEYRAGVIARHYSW